MRYTVLALMLLLPAHVALAVNNPNNLPGYEPSQATPAFTQALRTNDALFTALRNQPLLVARLMTNKSVQDQLANGSITVEAARAQLAPNTRISEATQPASDEPIRPSGRLEDGPTTPLRPGAATRNDPPQETAAPAAEPQPTRPSGREEDGPVGGVRIGGGGGDVRTTTPSPATPVNTNTPPQEATTQECYSGGPIAGPALTIPYCPGYVPETTVISSPVESTECYNGGPTAGPAPQLLPNCPEYDAYLRAQREIAAITGGTRTDISQTAAADIAQGVANMHSSSGGYVPAPIYDEAAAALAETALANATDGKPRTLTQEERGSLHDINAVPQQGNDKNGWPAYLDVPQSCALPDENRTYIYTPYAAQYTDFYRVGDRTTDYTTFNWIKPPFASKNQQGIISLIDTETYAIPFYAPNAAAEGSIALSYGGGIGRSGFIASIAACPDQFAVDNKCGRAGGLGSINISYRVDDNPLDGNTETNSGACNLQPGKLYYLNLRTNPDEPCGLAPENKYVRHASGKVYREGSDGKEYAICTRRIQHAGIDFSSPPYIGPAVTQDPRPINYQSGVGDVGIGQPFLEYLCKNSTDTSRLGTSFDMFSYCADPQDMLTPALYRFQCRNNLGGWVGERKTAFNTYACEQVEVSARELSDGKTGTIALAELFRTPREVRKQDYDSALCAKHREGQIRELRCVEDGRARTPQGYRQQQCQYVTKAKRYLWVNIDIDPAGTGLVDSYPVCVDERANQTQAGPGPGVPCRRFEGKRVQCGYHIVDAPAPRDSCSIFGKKFTLGTQRIATCGEDTLVHECRQFGEARHTDITPLPSFVYVSGESKINPDITPERCSFNIGSFYFPVTEKPRPVSQPVTQQEPSFGPGGTTSVGPGGNLVEEPSFGPGGNVTTGPGGGTAAGPGGNLTEKPSFGPGGGVTVGPGGGTAAGPGGNITEEPSFGPGGGVTVGPGGNVVNNNNTRPDNNGAVVTTPPPANVQDNTTSSSGGTTPAVTRPNLPSGRSEDGPPVRGASGGAVRTETAPLNNGRINGSGGGIRQRGYLDQK